MKRKDAQDINKCNQQINERLKTRKLNGISDKLLKDDPLTLKDIYELGHLLAEQQGYRKEQLIVCNTIELNVRLPLYKTDDIDKNPIFVICDDEKNTRIIFCLLKILNTTICLYKDFLDAQISERIQNILKQIFGENINFKVHVEVEKTEDTKNQDFLTLKMLEIMMIYLKSDKKEEFIESFASPKKNFFSILKSGVSYIKDELCHLVQESYNKTFVKDIDQLSSDTEFKKAIKKFIDSIQLTEEVSYFRKYQMLLKEFVEMEDENCIDLPKIKTLEKQLMKAREHAFSKITGLKIETSLYENGVRELDIVKKFPIQMEKFTRLFEQMSKFTSDENPDEILKEISSKLDLEPEKLKMFFTNDTKQKDGNEEVTFSIEKINDIIDALPIPKSKCSDLENTNKSFEQILSEVSIEKSKVLSIESLNKGYKKIKQFSKFWDGKGALEIHQWAACKKSHLKDSEIYEALAVMDRANELVTGGHRIRDTQILSALTFLQQQGQGQLTQIQTGEGKTTIVSLIAAIRALQGKNVDVVTSNPVLASDGIKDRKLFYNLLNLSATTNNIDENYQSGKRKCYKADIVYGSISNFQFDYLKDSFLGLETRGDRPFQSIILDEVDSMIIDNANHIAKLSGPLPGMESLKYVYINIWQALNKAEEQIVLEFQRKLNLKAQELQKIPENEEAQLLYEKYESELQNSITEEIKDCIKSSNPTKIDIIPSHIREYANNALDKWIMSAINAKYNYNEDEQYVIGKGKNGEKVVIPVDYANTGITLKNTIWQYGLHQFLQLKHNLHLTSENLTSCYISNLGYINKYGTEIFGLTGTLGSEAEQELLSSVYNVGFARIPTYKEKKFFENEGEVVDDAVFSAKVADDVTSEISRGRSCLVICETIKNAKDIQNKLKDTNSSIISYSDNKVFSGNKASFIKTFFGEENAHVTDSEINPGEVVIATNIAGRGTDFRTSAELENNKGLHVCVAFLPCNKRVEDQAFGRTARQGNYGTAKLIIKKSEIEKFGTYDFREIKNIRDQYEKERIQQIRELKILEIKFQDELFELFSTLHKNLKIDNQYKQEYKYVLDDLKEFWAFWLEKQGYQGSELTNKCVNQEFRNFKLEADKIIKGTIFFNPYYSIQQAENFIVNENLDKAEQALKHAISISKNPEILHSAYIKLFEIAIERGGVFMDKCRKAVGDVFFISAIEPDREYKENSKKYLKRTKEALKKELDYIESVFGAEEFTNIIIQDNSDELTDKSSGESQKEENLFIKHLVSKQQALNFNMCHVDSLIQQIDESKDGMSVAARISDYFSSIKGEKSDDEKKIKNAITDSELSELAAVGANTTYALRVVHDVCPEIVKGAQIQIGGGIALIASGICFPPALPVTSSIGGTMITEGICDIAMELINRNSDGKFNKNAYIKGKVISYGMSILTMGINAALQCPKILDKAKRACRWISDTLRKCPVLKGACEFLATKFDRLGDWFEKMSLIAKFNQMSKAEKLKYFNELKESKNLKHLKYLGDNIKQMENIAKELHEVGKLTELTRFENCVSTLQQVAITTLKTSTTRIAENIIMSKIVTGAMSSLMSKIKPTIKESVGKTIKENINREKLKLNSYEDIQNIIKDLRESIDFKTIRDIFKDAILGITKHCSDWRVQLGALAIDQFISWKEVYSYCRDLCKKINDKLKSAGKVINKNVDELVEKLVEELSEEIYAQVVNNTIKTCRDVYSVGTSAFANYSQEKQNERKCLDINKNFESGGQAGQEQAEALSDVIKRPIHIHEENGNIITIGDQYPGDPIEVNYFSPTPDDPTGHYTPKGQDRTWSSGNTSENNCLFDSVGVQSQRDPNKLRENTVRQIRSDPTRYIAPDVHEFFDPSILVEGGRTNQPIKENFYPSYKNRIEVAFEHVDVLADLRNDLTEFKEEYEQFCQKKESDQSRYMKHSKSVPQFGSNPNKEEMMMGSLHVKFNDGSELKFITVSGDEPFTVRQSLSGGEDLVYTKEPIQFTHKVRGFEFVDPGKPKGKIYDVYGKCETNTDYSKSCAGQKLLYQLSDHMKKNPNLEIKGNIKMSESWFKPVNAKFKGEQVIINKSCSHCEQVLPIATSKDSK